MTNKEIFKKEYNAKIIDIIFNEESVNIKLKNKDIILSTYHEQDCYENVYADFSVIKYYKDIIVGKKLGDLTIKAVPEMGFLLCFEEKETHLWYENFICKIFIPCYNEQNGYYSSELSLIIDDGEKIEIDISDLTEYRED